MTSFRQYDLILFGATGYTGDFAAHYIVDHAPTNLRWAIAGRSEDKLQKLKNDLDRKNPDRTKVEVMVAGLNEESWTRMAQNARLVLTGVGPYHRYGSGLVEACAKAGTHYVDVSGETVWLKEMIEKYHDLATKNGAIMISHCGFEAVPADMTTYALAKHIRSEFNAPTGDVRLCLHKLIGMFSGGSLHSGIGLTEHYSMSQLNDSNKPLCLAPQTSRSYREPNRPLVYDDEHLGVMAPWMMGVGDRSMVMRSWGLRKQFSQSQSNQDNDRDPQIQNWGDNFTFTEYRRVSNRIVGYGLFLATNLVILALLFPPFRWLAKKVVTAPGLGPGDHYTKNGLCEWRGVGEAGDGSGRKAIADFKYKGDVYGMTGLMMVEGALTILDDLDETSLAGRLKGGLLTSSCLGENFLRRLERAPGISISVRTL